ncbi:haloacid dehalogenase-like hydrolase [Penicillium maclennaniae]|uniref:haloacid dehalogenase-like hydrolase n=1 Tax=Penicillium maclennaniae TaxID=1343394 RepID=UPI00253FA67D|nr:haloacid dehalogenase-like hydrolase [Penicillium maclennaniae]KAJ5670643.1 haloacid dehalogenase-like hydrolase [Penicillium maclennaniae]
MPRFEDADFGVDAAPRDPRPSDAQAALSPREGRHPSGQVIPMEGGTLEVPASRSSLGAASAMMHHLSLQPSMRDRRGSRNSFGTSLPIPRSPRMSRLSRSSRPSVVRRDILAGQVQSLQSDLVEKVKNMAFVFDIDGVLAHGNEAIEEAKVALRILNGDNELGIQFPYILLTNGGGKTEEARCAQLTEVLGHPISTDQFIQSHTPMQALSEYYDNVLVLGGEGFKIREVAEQYGFKNVIHPKDIVAWDPTISPCRRFTEEDKKLARPRDFANFKFDAILYFAESYDQMTDFQIISDLLNSDNGQLLTRASKDQDHIPIYFSQGDLLCPTEHKGPPRLHLGAIRLAVEAHYKAVSGKELERTLYGKPERATYIYADEVLAAWMEELYGEKKLPKNIYMVGDNPASDIIGGNMYGWNTCLVRTGVFQGGENDEQNPANFGVFPHVLDAVKAALAKELGPDFKLKWDSNKAATSGSAIE